MLCHDLQTYYKSTYPEGSGKGNCGNCWTVTCEEPLDKSALKLRDLQATNVPLNSIFANRFQPVKSDRCPAFTLPKYTKRDYWMPLNAQKWM